MLETLLLRMPEPGRPAVWLILDAFGNRMGSPQGGTLMEAAPVAIGRRLRVLVPGSLVTLLYADIPTRNAQKVLQAVPFAVEDKLAEDVETLHFATGAREARGYPVAAVARTRMQHWLHELAAANLTPVELTPDILGLPMQHDVLTVVTDEAQLLARFPDGAAFAAEAGVMPFLLQRHLVTVPESGRCHHALIHAASEDAANAISQALGSLHLDTEYRPLSGNAIVLMCRASHDSSTINLLQGEFGVHGGMADRLRRWRTPGLLLSALCAILIVQQTISEIRLTHEAASLNAQVRALFHQALPDITRMERPRVQMTQALSQLNGGNAAGAGLLPMLAAVGNALQSEKDVQLESFSYQAGSLKLQIQAASSESLDNLKTALARDPEWQVALQSVTRSAGRTAGRLTLSGRGP